MTPACEHSPWRAPSRGPLEIEEAAVHVWRLHVAEMAPFATELLMRLSTDEQLRAERFRAEKPRVQFIAGRSALRNILGRYLGIAAEDVRFAYSDRGKPQLEH